MRTFSRWLLYACLLGIIFGPWLAWETDRNQVRRALYPVRGQLAAWSTQCSAQAPTWLGTLTQALATAHDSPANQLALIAPDGTASTCTNGWEDLPVLSPRLAPDTPMRLASLSKIISFMGMTHLPPAARSLWLETPLVQAVALQPPYADTRVGAIRIRHLLNHSAGFDRLKSDDPMATLRHRPWCPSQLQQLAHTPLDYPPGERFSYHNLDYCLAAAAYEHQFGRSLWEVLEADMHLHDYGLDWLDRRDTPVQYNFMHSAFFGPDFTQKLDWQAARAPMGLTGNASGIAHFIHTHRDLLEFSKGMRDDTIACKPQSNRSCYDGFLNRTTAHGRTVWQQGGYLYGMAALFVMDEAGNLLVWLGAGEGRPLSAAPQRIRQALFELTP